MGQSGVLKSETQYTPNGTVETVYPNGKQAGRNESTTVWKDKKGNLYRTQEKLENGNIYNNIKYDDGTEVKVTAANGSISVTVLKQGENPVNYHYNSSDSVFEAFDNEGNVTHRGKFENGAWIELDKDGNTVKTYEHKDKKHHYVRNTIIGVSGVAAVAAGLEILLNDMGIEEKLCK